MGSHTPLLRHDALYLGDNGRCFCGRLHHAGRTAHFTGRDLSGQRVHPVTETDQREARRMGVTLACETCTSEQRNGRTEVSRSAAPQAEYARLSALVQVRLDQLRQALVDHEATGRWGEQEFLERIEAGLAEFIAEVPRP